MKKINYIVIQSGQCVFGAGNTRSEAIEDASRSMELRDDSGCEISDSDERIQAVENEISAQDEGIDGGIYVLDSSDDEFDDYLKNQGGFTRTDDGWYWDDFFEQLAFIFRGNIFG